MKTWHRRLAHALTARNLKAADLARQLNIKPPSVSAWLSGETKNMRGEHLPEVCSYLGVNPNWLIRGIGPSGINTEGIDSTPIYKEIEQYNVIGAMGTGVVLQDQAGVIHEWQVSEEWLRQNIKGATSPKNLKIVTGFGDSMQGMFNSGDPLIVDIGVRGVEFDGVYFFRVENEGFIKRLQRIPGVGLRAISENKAYESWNISEGMDFEVFGRVLKVWQGANY